MFAAVIAIPLSISRSMQGSSKLRAPTPVCAIGNMAEWNNLPDARSPIDPPPAMAWHQMVKDNNVFRLPQPGWLCSQFEYFNDDAFNGQGCRGYISLAWNPRIQRGGPAEVAIKYSSFGKSTIWHGRWFALTAPQPGITMHFDYQGRGPLADRKWTTIFLPRLKEGTGLDYQNRKITLTWLCDLVRGEDKWVELDGCPGFDLNAPPEPVALEDMD